MAKHFLLGRASPRESLANWQRATGYVQMLLLEAFTNPNASARGIGKSSISPIDTFAEMLLEAVLHNWATGCSTTRRCGYAATR